MRKGEPARRGGLGWWTGGLAVYGPADWLRAGSCGLCGHMHSPFKSLDRLFASLRICRMKEGKGRGREEGRGRRGKEDCRLVFLFCCYGDDDVDDVRRLSLSLESTLL